MYCCGNVYTEREEVFLYHPKHRHRHHSHSHPYQQYINAQSPPPRLASWLVLAGSMLNHFLIEALCFFHMSLFGRIQAEFSLTSRLLASLPTTLLVGVYLIVAPVALFLTKKYDTRRVSVFGSLLASLALLASAWCVGEQPRRHLALFAVSAGALTGAGLGLVHVATVVATSGWFLRGRMLAASGCVVAACVGACVAPMLAEWALAKYELADALLILAGVQLNCLVGSLLLRRNARAILVSKASAFRRRAHGHNQQQELAKAEESGRCNDQCLTPRGNKDAKIANSTSSAHLLENETLNGDFLHFFYFC